MPNQLRTIPNQRAKPFIAQDRRMLAVQQGLNTNLTSARWPSSRAMAGRYSLNQWHGCCRNHAECSYAIILHPIDYIHSTGSSAKLQLNQGQGLRQPHNCNGARRGEGQLVKSRFHAISCCTHLSGSVPMKLSRSSRERSSAPAAAAPFSLAIAAASTAFLSASSCSQITSLSTVFIPSAIAEACTQQNPAQKLHGLILMSQGLSHAGRLVQELDVLHACYETASRTYCRSKARR